MGLVGCRLEYSQPLAPTCAPSRGLARAAAAGRYAAHYTEKYVLMPDSFFPTDFRQTCAGLSPKGFRALPSVRRLQPPLAGGLPVMRNVHTVIRKSRTVLRNSRTDLFGASQV